MKYYEYEVYNVSNDEFTIQKHLNEKAKFGWELVTINQADSVFQRVTISMKREKA